MTINDDDKNLSYADEAFMAFHEIMSNKQKNTLEDMNRTNKGEPFVLHFLSMRADPVLPSELSAALQASTARVSALLGSLEKKGLIKRDIDKNNRRNILVTITEAGHERAKAERKDMQRNMTRVFMDMGEADTAEFLRLTRRFFDLSQKYAPSPPGQSQRKDGVHSG